MNKTTQSALCIVHSAFCIILAALPAAALDEITAGNDITISATPAETDAYGLNGGNLTIAGAGTVVTQNVPVANTMDGVNFGSFWPWIQGVVTVENGAALESDTLLFCW